MGLLSDDHHVRHDTLHYRDRRHTHLHALDALLVVNDKVADGWVFGNTHHHLHSILPDSLHNNLIGMGSNILRNIPEREVLRLQHLKSSDHLPRFSYTYYSTGDRRR